MGVLIASQWRLLRSSLYLWTALAVLNAVFLARPGSSSDVPGLPHFPIVFLMLSAALGARSFASGVSGAAGTWLRSLPIPDGHVFIVKCATGLGLVAASIVFVGIFWSVAVPPILALHGVEANVPGFEEWLLGSLYCLGPFAASAYLASSFERVRASRQAGVAGFFVGLISCTLIGAGQVGEALFGLVGVIGLLAAWRLSRRRGVDENAPGARVLRQVPRRDQWIVLPAQTALVIVPLWFGLSDELSGAAPFLGRSTLTLTMLASFVIGLAFLPWGWKDIRARGIRGWKRLSALALIATGAGAWLWKSLRPRGSIVQCTSCGWERLDSSVRCPRCGAEPLLFVAHNRFRKLLPYTPGGIALWCFTYLLFGSCLLGGQRYIHAYEIRTDLPGAEIALGENRTMTGVLRDWQTGPRMGPRLGGSYMNPGAAILQDPQEASLPISKLADLLHEGRSEAVLPAPSDYLRTIFPSPTRLDLRCRGYPCELTSAEAHLRAENFVVRLDLRFGLNCPELERTVTELIGAWRSGIPSPELFSSAEAWGDALFVSLWEQRHKTDRTALRPLVDVLVRRRYQIATNKPRPVLADLDRLVEQFEWRNEGNWTEGFEPLRYTYPQTRALSFMDDSIEPLLRERIARGDPSCTLAAGMGQFDGCFQACERAFVGRCLRGDRSRSNGLCAAWSMLAIDSERALDVILPAWSRMDDQAQYVLAIMLGFTHEPRAADWLREKTGTAPSRPTSRRPSYGFDLGLENYEAGRTLEDYIL